MGSEISDRSKSWHASRQQYCRDARQISERYDKLNTNSRGFKTSRDLITSPYGLMNRVPIDLLHPPVPAALSITRTVPMG